MLLMPMASHDKNGPVAPHFGCLDVRIAMVILMIPLVSQDADTYGSGII